MLEISELLLKNIFQHSEESYPNECCGIIVGTADKGIKQAKEVYRGTNTVVDRARDRYELDPQDILRAQRECRGRGLEIIGFYHSHPDHPSRPSQYDAERAWPFYSYLIVSVNKGKVESARCWQLNSEAGAFEAEDLIIKK